MKLIPSMTPGAYYLRCGEREDDADPETECSGDAFTILKLPDGRVVLMCDACSERHELQAVLNAREGDGS